jgi:hypothetical protein
MIAWLKAAPDNVRLSSFFLPWLLADGEFAKPAIPESTQGK